MYVLYMACDCLYCDNSRDTHKYIPSRLKIILFNNSGVQFKGLKNANALRIDNYHECR